MSTEKPWEDYADPLAAPAAPAAPGAAPAVGQGEDLLKGMAGGVGRGISGAIGLPGTVQGLVRGGLDYLLPPSQKQLDVRKQAPNLLPSGQTVQSAIEDKTGKFYDPQTPLGQYGSTLTEFAVAAPLAGATRAAKVFNTVVPAVASETAGQVTKGSAAEPWARGAAGIVAGPAAAKLVTLAAKFKSDIRVTKDGREVSGKSIMGVMMLAAGKGSRITFRAEGPDAEKALDAIEALIARKFDEAS